ncbi:hypothetical protein HK414_19730 [Ramlibacter terrae]|uniref:Uncharacterized protein n=1 Tax=Ramlibacter terrae TaxID=2732511 RepID=A0ABX6P677_9BURK|nr:hypothetical protein HK414_19730 [Ramlibacter terrae]
MQGTPATVAIVLGTAAPVATLATARWLLHSVVRPLGPATDAVARISRGDRPPTSIRAVAASCGRCWPPCTRCARRCRRWWARCAPAPATWR